MKRRKKTKLLLKIVLFVFIVIPLISVLINHGFLKKKNKIPLNINNIEETFPKQSQIRLPIILYHYVEYVKDPGDFIRRGLDVTPRNFEEQLKSLKNNQYQTYFIKDIPRIMEGKIKYSTPSAVLTFDDGFEDFYTDAFPLLKKYKTKATIYVVYNFIGHPNYMNKSQLQEVINSGLVELGSHSLNHVNLASEAASLAKKEIADSKKKLEEDFGIIVETFAYPYGAFNKTTLDLVKEASYSAAVTVKPGMIQTEENIFKLLRIRPGIFSGGDMVKILEKIN
ncbi:MAG: polysaccharide deacetylase family protein [Patescibacteria group bacterium]|nr:polysaccharide deacetylase family protein [Patescibacteria group bacterium]